MRAAADGQGAAAHGRAQGGGGRRGGTERRERRPPRRHPRAAQVVCGAKGTKEDPKAQGELSGMLKELGYAKEEVFKF